MNQAWKAILTAVISAAITAGAFSVKIEFTRAEAQERLGGMIMTLTSGCR